MTTTSLQVKTISNALKTAKVLTHKTTNKVAHLVHIYAFTTSVFKLKGKQNEIKSTFHQLPKHMQIMPVGQ